MVDAEMADQAAKLLASGMSGSACARQLGIPVSTFNENRRAGVITDPARAPAAGAEVAPAATTTDHPVSTAAAVSDPAVSAPAVATDRASRDARDKHAPMGSGERATWNAARSPEPAC